MDLTRKVAIFENSILNFTMQEDISLDKLKVGERAMISKFTSEKFPAKFYEMGLLPDTWIEIRHLAPFKGPICINLIHRNILIALRISEAKNILVCK